MRKSQAFLLNTIFFATAMAVTFVTLQIMKPSEAASRSYQPSMVPGAEAVRPLALTESSRLDEFVQALPNEPDRNNDQE